MSLARPTALVIHDDGDVLDVLTRLFEAAGFEVVTAVTGFRAQAVLEGDRATDLVVVPWDAQHPVGGEMYRWALHQRYDLRDGFVFLGLEPPPDGSQLVAGRCLWAAMARPAEVVRISVATVERRRRLDAARDAVEVTDAGQPTLLLADDEPALLMAMADLFSEDGYAVARVESGHGAIELLGNLDVDAIVIDWNMDDGTGADVYRWIVLHKPWLAERVVFLSDGEADDAAVVAPGRPMFRKGQDAGALSDVLHEIIRSGR